MNVPCLGCQADAVPCALGVAAVSAFMSAAVLFALDPRQIALYAGGFCDHHRRVGASQIVALATANGRPVEEVVAKLEEAFGPARG